MNNDLKKVGLVFKADGTTDFIKSLRTINDSLTTNYSQFKKVQAEWDNSTKSSEKLKSKLDYLNNAYDLQKNKVNLLSTELEELKNAEERDEQAIQKKTNQLTKAETKLISYKKQINETTAQLQTSTNHLITYGENLEKIGKKADSASKKLSGISLAATAGLTASIKTAIDFEDAFAGVQKTVDATEEEFAVLKKGIMDMAEELPASTTEISAVAEAAGQLGIQKENILSFTRTMIDLGEATNLTANDAADSLARFANITNMSQKDFDKLGSTIVSLGNNSATTESEIVSMAMRIAGAGSTVGMSEADIVSFAAALSSVGIEAEAGGSAFSKMMINIESDVSSGKGHLEDYARIAGMTANEFKKAWAEDASGAMISFIEGLGNVEKNGGNLINTLSDLDITEVRLRDAVLRAANASDLFADTVALGNNAWKENNALSVEAQKRYATLKSQFDMAINKIKNIAITLGNKLMPSLQKGIDYIGKLTDKFDDLSEEQVDMIVKVGLVVAALSPLLKLFSTVSTTIGGTMKAIGSFSQALKGIQGDISSTSNTVNSLSTVFSAITSPVGLACTAIAASIAIIKVTSDNAMKDVKSDFDTMGQAAADFYNGIQTAESHLGSFNSTLFATNEEQQNLTANMQEIQNGITEITRRASEERRSYTSEEIQKLDEYFEELRNLKNRELEIENQVAGAIAQQAQTIAETHNGSLEEYKTTAQEWIKTAQEQKDKEIELINQRTIEEIALLNARYGEKATLDNEEYKREYDLIMTSKENAINSANEQVAKVSEVFANGYTNRMTQNEEFYNKFKEANAKLEEAERIHAQTLEDIENGDLHGHMSRWAAKKDADTDYKNTTKKIWKELCKNMSDSEVEQLGTWLGMTANSELYGGKISDESKNMADTILKNWDKLPKESRKTMENTMSPMLEEMQKSEPSLFSKASSIANGILSRLKKAFNIHSPSKETRSIFQNVMKGAEIGLEDEEKKLYQKTDKIANQIKENLSNIQPELEVNDNADFSRQNAPYSTNNIEIIIDYLALTKAIMKALNSCKIKLDSDGFIQIIDDRLQEVV